MGERPRCGYIAGLGRPAPDEKSNPAESMVSNGPTAPNATKPRGGRRMNYKRNALSMCWRLAALKLFWRRPCGRQVLKGEKTFMDPIGRPRNTVALGWVTRELLGRPWMGKPPGPVVKAGAGQLGGGGMLFKHKTWGSFAILTMPPHGMGRRQLLSNQGSVVGDQTKKRRRNTISFIHHIRVGDFAVPVRVVFCCVEERWRRGVSASIDPLIKESR